MLAALLVDPQNGLSVADLARKTRFIKPATVFAVDTFSRTPTRVESRLRESILALTYGMSSISTPSAS